MVVYNQTRWSPWQMPRSRRKFCAIIFLLPTCNGAYNSKGLQGRQPCLHCETLNLSNPKMQSLDFSFYSFDGGWIVMYSSHQLNDNSHFQHLISTYNSVAVASFRLFFFSIHGFFSPVSLPHSGQLCHGFPFINLAGSGETVNGLSVQIIISLSVVVTCQLSQSSPRRLCQTLTRTLSFISADANGGYDIGITGHALIELHARGVRRIVAQLIFCFIATCEHAVCAA